MPKSIQNEYIFSIFFPCFSSDRCKSCIEYITVVSNWRLKIICRLHIHVELLVADNLVSVPEFFNCIRLILISKRFSDYDQISTILPPLKSFLHHICIDSALPTKGAILFFWIGGHEKLCESQNFFVKNRSQAQKIIKRWLGVYKFTETLLNEISRNTNCPCYSQRGLVVSLRVNNLHEMKGTFFLDEKMKITSSIIYLFLYQME